MANSQLPTEPVLSEVEGNYWQPVTVYILLSNWALAPNPSPLNLGTFTFVENSLQIAHFMQNKPNLPDSQINVSSISTKDYENERLRRRGENKPKTNPTCRGVASGEAGSNPIYVELTKTSKGANSMFFNIIKEQSEEKDALLRVVSALDGMAEYCVWKESSAVRRPLREYHQCKIERSLKKS